MLGSAGPPGNSGHDWLALAKQMTIHAGELQKLTRPVGPEYEPSREKVSHLDRVNSCLRDIFAHAENVGRHILGTAYEDQLAEPLNVFSDVLQTALRGVFSLRNSVTRELTTRSEEEARPGRRSLEEWSRDDLYIYDLSNTVRAQLIELRKHMVALSKDMRRLT